MVEEAFFEDDCGAALFIMPVQVYTIIMPSPSSPPASYHPSEVHHWGKDHLLLGELPCILLKDHECQNLKLIFTSNELAASLLGTDWLSV
jgi:hypothetical protein